jgi:hypothetical protein
LHNSIGWDIGAWEFRDMNSRRVVLLVGVLVIAMGVQLTGTIALISRNRSLVVAKLTASDGIVVVMGTVLAYGALVVTEIPADN